MKARMVKTADETITDEIGNIIQLPLYFFLHFLIATRPQYKLYNLNSSNDNNEVDKLRNWIFPGTLIPTQIRMTQVRKRLSRM